MTAAGIAVLMIVSQIGKATGIPVEAGSLAKELASAAGHIGEAHWPTAALTLAVLVVLFAFHRLAPTWPGPLIAMLGAAAVVAVFGLTARAWALLALFPGTAPHVRSARPQRRNPRRA